MMQPFRAPRTPKLCYSIIHAGLLYHPILIPAPLREVAVIKRPWLSYQDWSIMFNNTNSSTAHAKTQCSLFTGTKKGMVGEGRRAGLFLCTIVPALEDIGWSVCNVLPKSLSRSSRIPCSFLSRRLANHVSQLLFTLHAHGEQEPSLRCKKYQVCTRYSEKYFSYWAAGRKVTELSTQFSNLKGIWREYEELKNLTRYFQDTLRLQLILQVTVKQLST